MKKILCVFAVLASVGFFAQGCGDDGGSGDSSCSADVCKDANTLTKCNADGTTTDETCANGCDTATNKCKEAEGNKCSGDVCKDGDILLVCNSDGSTTEKFCEEGCDSQTKSCITGLTYPEAPKSCSDNTNAVCTSSSTTYICSDWWGMEPELFIEHCAANRRCTDGVCVVRNDQKCGSDYCKDVNTAVECRDGVPTEVKCDAGQLCFDRKCRTSHIRSCTSSDECENTETCYNGLCYLKSNMELQVNDACNSLTFQEYCKDGIEYKCGYDDTVETNDCKDYNGCSTILQKGYNSEKPVFNAACRGITENLAACTQPGVVLNRCYNQPDPDYSFYMSNASVCVVGTDGQYVYQVDQEQTNCGNKKCNEETGLCYE